MYRLSKIKSQYIAAFFLFFLLIFLPFKAVIQNIFVFLANKPLFLSKSSYTRQLNELKQENLKLTLENKKFEHLRTENEKLKAALGFAKTQKISLLGVEVIAFTPSIWQRSALINKGVKSQIKKDSFVIDEAGNLLGKITDVEENFSRLTFADDPDFSTTVFIGQKNFGFLKGNLVGAKLLYVEKGTEVKAGEKVWVKIPNIALPIHVGEVKRARRNDNDLFWDIEVRLSIKADLLDKMFVIK